MRKRRLAKCLLRADLAIEDGNVEEARAALDEAQELDPESAEIASLEQRLAAMQFDLPAALTIPPPERSLSGPIVVGAGLLILAAAGVAFGARYWTSGPAPAAVTAVAAVEPAAVSSAGVPGPKPPPDRLEIVRETLTVPQATPRIVEEQPRLPSVPGPPIADAAPEQPPVALAANRAADPAPPPDTLNVRPELPIEALPERPVVVAPSLKLAPPHPEPTPPATSAPAESAPARTESTDAVNAALPRDETIVRSVLRQYESAYSRLDASAASAVWPGVNRGALARAFEGLESQRFSLGSCDVAVNGPEAHATCSGSATWEPKVGGGLRTEARRWDFALRKSGGGWQIERAITAKPGADLR